MEMTHPILVTGPTGNTGAPIVRALAETGAPVRAMVRDPGTRLPAGIEPVVADLDDASAVRAALDGIRRAYLVSPSSERAEAQQTRFVELAAEAGVERVVLLSQLGARRDSPVRFLHYHGVVEERLRATGTDHVILRPNLFMQGLLGFAPMIAAAGRFIAPIGDARVSAIDVRDIAAVAVRALLDDGHGGSTYTLTGPEAVTHAEMADTLSAATGRPVSFVDVSPDEFSDALHGVLPPWQLDGLVEDYAHYRRGEAEVVSADAPTVLGRPARSLAVFVTDHRDAFGPG